ncbi:MAG: GNAT family N-acetyltransferase [Eubacterium sp.]|nr:GNAT family N-acetyltransferase [Eubacterium sp.]
MKVIPFEEKYRQDFIAFNTDWIVSNFGCLEEHDIETFEKIDEQIAAGAMIFFAVENDTALATCMATPMEGTTWEICKLGSNKKIPHKGAGSAVFEAAMEWALCHGAERLFILSNSKLKPALHIYEKYGFQEIKLDNYEYTRGDIAFEYKKETAWDTKAVVKKEDAVKKVFQGVSLDSLAVGSKSQVTKMNYVAGDYASFHQHPHEQSGYVISGKYELTIGDGKYELTAGDSYAIPGNQVHSFRVLEGGEVVDVFTPPREDYLS